MASMPLISSMVELWEKDGEIVVAEVGDADIKVGIFSWCDYVSFAIDMEKYGYKPIGESYVK